MMNTVHPLAEYLAPLAVDISDSEKESVIGEAVKNLTAGNAYLIGFSGKKAAGKDTLAMKFQENLPIMAGMTQISAGIKNEASEMFGIFYEWIEREKSIHADNLKSGRSAATFDTSSLETERAARESTRYEKFATRFNVTHRNIDHIYKTVYSLLKTTSGIDGYSRANEVIAALQYLGKDVRQPQDDVYWTRKMLWLVALNASKGITSLVPDVRFTHDAQSVTDCGGYLIRIDIDKDEQVKRLQNRDGVVVSDDILNHPSETELDDYTGFDLRIDSQSGDADEIYTVAAGNWRKKVDF